MNPNTLNKLFLKYATYIWPIHRKFVKKTPRCKICTISEKYTPLYKGVCGYCKQYNTFIKNNNNKKIDPVDLSYFLRTNNDKYNSIMMLSGGKDSAYVLSRLICKYPKIIPLCVLIDNGYMSDVAVENAKYTCKQLNCDITIVKSEIDNFKKIFHNSFKELKKPGKNCFNTVDYNDGEYLYSLVWKMAKEMDIKNIFCGLSSTQSDLILNNTSGYIKKDDTYLFMPLVWWNTSETEILDYVKHEGLLLKTSSPVVTNHTMIGLGCMIDILNYGYSSFEIEFSKMIREGKAKKYPWLYVFELLEYLVTRGKLNKQIKEGLKSIDLELKDVLK